MIVTEGAGPARYLVELQPGDLARVRFVAFEFVRSEGWDLPIRPGEVLRFLEEDAKGVTVARPNGSTVFVPRACARLIGIQAAESGPAPPGRIRPQVH